MISHGVSLNILLMACTQSMVVTHKSAGLIFDAIVRCAVPLNGLGEQ